MLTSLEVAVSSRQAIVVMVEPKADRTTGGAAMPINVRK